jgi:hypothetical protein
LTALVALFALCSVPVGWPGTPSATAAPTRPHAAGPGGATAPDAPDPMAITLETLTPKVVRPGDTLVVAGTVTNTSATTLTDMTVELRASTRRITTRYELSRDFDPATKVGSLIPSTWRRLGKVEPGEQIYWSVTLPANSLYLPRSGAQFGAYPLAIELTAVRDSKTTTARLPTTLIWMPDDAQFQPTKVAWLWPLTDGVHRGLGGVFLDDDLATDLAPTGRLGELLRMATDAGIPLSYAVDPALTDDATAMAASARPGAAAEGGSASSAPGTRRPTTTESPTTGSPTSGAGGESAGSESPDTGAVAAQTGGASTSSGEPSPGNSASKGSTRPSARPTSTTYRVQHGNATVAGKGAEIAADWLASLRSAVQAPDAALIGLPYGDADLVALDRAGLDKEIATARSTGESVLASTLARPTLPEVVWPLGSTVNERTLDDLVASQVDAVVLSDETLPPRDANAVGTPRTDIETPSGTVRAVLTDSVINALVANPTGVRGGPRAAEQQFLAQTMLVTEQRPGAGSSLVLAPPRHVDASTPYLAEMLADTGQVPWLQPVGLEAVIAEPADDIARQPLKYSAQARAAELNGTALSAVSGLRDDLANFSAVLGTNASEPFLKTAGLAILRAESSRWRTDPDGSLSITSAVRKQLTAHTNRVYISDPRLITMTSRKQKIPLTVVNDLPEPVTLQLRLRALNSARLTVTPVEPFTVNGKGSRHEVLVEVDATTSGRFQVEAQLMTPESTPRPFSAPVSFELNSTAYGAVALAIASGAAGLLVLVSALRIYRRLRRRGPPTGPPGQDADNDPSDDPAPDGEPPEGELPEGELPVPAGDSVS